MALTVDTVMVEDMGMEGTEGMATAEEGWGMELPCCWVLACLHRWCCLVADSGSFAKSLAH